MACSSGNLVMVHGEDTFTRYVRITMSKAEEKLKSYIIAVRQLKAKNKELATELRESMKIIRAQKAAGSTINQDCMTGQCEAHRSDLLTANTEYYAENSNLTQKLYMSWIAFGIMGALLLYFRRVI